MEQQSSADDFKKNVLLLKPRDVTERGDHVFTPTLNILSKLRKTQQFKRDLVFSRNMSAVDVRKKLVEAFPELENKRFSCAKRDNRDSPDLNFKGDRRVWDGKTIKKLPGSSAMYIFVEDETSQVQGAANDTDCLSAVQHPSSYTPTDLEGVKPGCFDAYWQDIVDVLNEDCKYSDGLRSCQSQTMQTESGRKISDSNEPNRIDVNTGEISETGYSSGANSTQAQGLCQETAVTTSVTRTSFRVYHVRETAYSSDEASSTQGQGLFQETVEATGTRNPSRLFHGRGTADSSEEGSSSKEQTFDVTMNPKSGPPEGGNRCFWLEFKNSLHSSVTSGWAKFGPYGTVKVRRISDDDFTMFGKEIPRGRPGLVTVTITTESGFYLGKAFFTYEDPENETNQQVLCNKRKIEELSDIVQNLAKMFKQQGLANQAGQVEPQKILKPLVYAAAEAGAMRLIETIFSLSAGRVAFQTYKEDIYLPEDIAEENGHTDVAAYLRATTKRYSEKYDISTDRSRSVAFDWTELANALEDIELYQSATKPSSDKDLNQIWEDDIIETGYSADGEASSSGSEKENSDSDVELVKMSACRESRDDEKQQQPIVLARENPLENPDKSSYCSQWLSDCGKGKLLIETPWHSTKSLKGKEDSVHKNMAGFPPALTLELPMKSDLPSTFKPWDEVHLPVDILLLTVDDSEILACFAYLRNAFKSYLKNFGYVYFGNMGESGDVPLKVALMTCSESSSAPHGSLVTVKNAVVELRPKAAFYVGYCVDTNLQLGDVVVSSKLTTDSLKTPVGRDILHLVRHADHGWIPPLKSPEDHKVQVCCDGDILSGINTVSAKQQNMSHFTEATAYEIGGEGLFGALHELKIEWVIVKGNSHFANGNNPAEKSWESYACIMAASLVSNMLNNSCVFEQWPHYEDPANKEELPRSPDSLFLEECQKQLRSLYEAYSKVKIVPWDQSSAVHIDNVYTQLSWLMDEKDPNLVTQKERKHYTDIVDGGRLQHTPKQIFYFGRPGIGKNLFKLKGIFGCSQHRFKGKFQRFDLVLLAKLRDVCNLNDVPPWKDYFGDNMSECIVHKESLRSHRMIHQSLLLRSRSCRSLFLDDSRVAEACLVDSPLDMPQSFSDDSSVFSASPRSTEVHGRSLFDLTPNRPFNTSPNPQRRLFSCLEDRSLTTPSPPCLQSLFYDINEDVGASWRKLGRHLSIKECVLNHINEDFTGVSEKAIQVLFKWKEDNGASATPEALFSALLHIRRADVAKKLESLFPTLLPLSCLRENVLTSDCTLYSSYALNPENLKVKKVLQSKDEKFLVCSTSESSERFLLKQVEDKENTFAVRKCLDCKALRQQHKQLRKTEEFLKELEMKQKMVQDLLNVIEQLQNHLVTQQEAITQEQVSCHNCGQYNIKQDLMLKELTLLHHELERMIKSNRRISFSGIPTERIYNVATRTYTVCEEHKEMHTEHNKRRLSFCQHPDMTESDEGGDYIEGPLMGTISVITRIGRRRKVTQSLKPKKSIAGNKMKVTKSNGNPLSSTENLGVSKRNSYLLAPESPIMVSSVSQSQSQSPRDWSGVRVFTMCSDLKVPCSSSTLSKCKKARNLILAENPSTAKLGRNSQEIISLHLWEGLDEGEMII